MAPELDRSASRRLGSSSLGRPPFTDVLLHLDAYPETTPAALLDQAVATAAQLAPNVCAIVDEPNFDLRVNRIVDRIARVSVVEHEQDRRAREAVESVLARFEAAVAGQRLRASHCVVQCRFGFAFGPRVAEAARSFDLCLIPYSDQADGQRSVAQAVVFGSGRPVLLWQGRDVSPQVAGSVAIAWDGGRAAARAVADALPILVGAERVTVVTVKGGERAPPHTNIERLLAHLSRHNIQPRVEDLRATRRSADDLLVEFAREHDLMVMGAFRRSPATGMLLGGMTARFLVSPPTPVFLSH